MLWSFTLPRWLTGHDMLRILGPSAGGTAFLNSDAFSPLLTLLQLSGCSYPVPAPCAAVSSASWRLCSLLGSLAAAPGGNPGSLWALGTAWLRAACGQVADGDPTLALAAGSLAWPARGPGLQGDMPVRGAAG